MNKTCTKCKIDKNINEYHHRKDRPIGYASICNLCQREKVRKYRITHKDDLLLKDKNKRLNIPYRLHRSCKHSAIRRGLEFTLSVEDIHIPDLCPYLGVPITNVVGEGFQDFNPSIDRVDNSKGYHKDNIEIISVLANKMKHTATTEQLVSFANHVLNRYAVNKL